MISHSHDTFGFSCCYCTVTVAFSNYCCQAVCCYGSDALKRRQEHCKKTSSKVCEPFSGIFNPSDSLQCLLNAAVCGECGWMGAFIETLLSVAKGWQILFLRNLGLSQTELNCLHISGDPELSRVSIPGLSLPAKNPSQWWIFSW